MTKRALPAVVALLGLCFSLSAQEAPQRARISVVRFTPAPRDPAVLTLADGRLFSFPSAFGWIASPSVDFLPAFAAGQRWPVSPAVPRVRDDSSHKAVDLLPRFDYAGGEAGVFYGKSSGRDGREVKRGYLLGEVVDGNTHITVGASYDQSSGRLPSVVGRR